MIEIRNTPLRMKCAKRTLFFTRDTKTLIYNAVRCPAAGSCTKGMCSGLRSNDTVEELSKARRYPGYSGCEFSCGGLTCGCLLPLSACSFYRVAHVPQSKQVYEVIDCQEWNPTIQLEVQVSLYNKHLKKEIVLLPYITEKWANLRSQPYQCKNHSCPS